MDRDTFEEAMKLDYKRREIGRIRQMMLGDGFDGFAYHQAIEFLGESNQLEEIKATVIKKLTEKEREIVDQFYNL